MSLTLRAQSPSNGQAVVACSRVGVRGPEAFSVSAASRFFCPTCEKHFRSFRDEAEWRRDHEAAVCDGGSTHPQSNPVPRSRVRLVGGLAVVLLLVLGAVLFADSLAALFLSLAVLVIVALAILVGAGRNARRHFARSKRDKPPLTRVERLLVIFAAMSAIGGMANEWSLSEQRTVAGLIISACAGAGGAILLYYLLRSCWRGSLRLFRWVQAGA